MRDRDLAALAPRERHRRARQAQALAASLVSLTADLADLEAELVVIATALGIPTESKED